MWFLESPPARALLVVLAEAPACRWNLDELFTTQGWRVLHDTARPTGYLVVDTGLGSEEDACGLLLYLDDAELTMLTAVLGRFVAATPRSTLVPVLWRVSQRYGMPQRVDDGVVWDTGTGRLLVGPENGLVTAVWATRRLLSDPAGLRTAGLSMHLLDQLVTNAAGGPDWADAVARATQLVSRDAARDRWEHTAVVSLMVDMTAKEQGISPAQVREQDIAEPLAAVRAAASQPQAPGPPQ
jgi:hypothetical protein